MRNIEFLFRSPGLIEAIAMDPKEESQEPLITEGYRSVWLTDFMIDYHPDTDEPYCFMSEHFHHTYPLVIWALKMNVSERFNLPQAGLTDVPTS